LPDIATLQRDARRWGINADSTVVVYDDGKGTSAARLWWVLRWAGAEKVYILDGGYAAWKAAGQATTREAGVNRRGRIELKAGHLPNIGADKALDIAASGTLLDARGREAYEGHAGQSGTGHIPGAHSVPAAQFQEADGRLKARSVLRDLLGNLGVDIETSSPIAVYCGSGVAAAYGVAALQTLGVSASLYPGSWTEWVKDPGRPVAVGPARD
jgi:thiosulfate/3-mercaptopyruvate sulfurtransferase